MERKPLPWSQTKCPYCSLEESSVDKHDRTACRVTMAATMLATALRANATPAARQRLTEKLQQVPTYRGELMEFFFDDRSAIVSFLKHLAGGDQGLYDQLLTLVEGERRR